MRGSTRKRGSTWTALWDVTDPATGHRRQKSKGGFKRQRDAQRFLQETLPAVQSGTYVEPSREPLATFIETVWLPSISATVRPLTLATYRNIANNYVKRRDIGGVPLRELTGGHLNGLYAELEAEGLSVATRRLTHAVLRRALNDAVRWDKLARNPAASADPPSVPRSYAQAWSSRELRQFLAATVDDRLSALWRLAATTGMRRGELLGLMWRFVDLDAERVRIEQQLMPTKGGVTFGPPKSRRSERTIALDLDTVAMLRHHREVQMLERDLAGDAYNDQDLVFCDELGSPIPPSTFGKWFVRSRKAAGVPTGSPHILRHTAATIALTEGVPLHVVAARLGDDPTTVLSTYAHLLPTSDAEAAMVVAAVLVDKPLTTQVAELAEAL